MGLTAGTPLREIKVDTVFLGSCTNGRIEDLRVAAELLRGKHIDPDTRMLVVPGSVGVKAQAEAEGLDRVFLDAGAEWRGAGCSMCLGMNPDQLKPGERSASTSNRNFQGRQGKGGRTHLVSPSVAAATALTGKLTAPADLTTAEVDWSLTMDAFTTHTGTAAPLRRSNVDTDQIIPAEYLKRITRTGFEDGLFVAWRTNEPDFVLNQPQYADASILVAGPDFGTGSSREHAVLGAARRRLPGRHQLPVRRHLPQQLDQGRPAHRAAPAGATSRRCGRAIEADPATQVTVDLQAKQVTYGDVTVPFEIDDYTRWRLLEGLDDVGLTERQPRRHRDLRGDAVRPGCRRRRSPGRDQAGASGSGVEVAVVVGAQRPGPAAQHPHAALRGGRVAAGRRRPPSARRGPAAPTGSPRPGCRRR